MTNTWQDIKNANVILVMGGNAQRDWQHSVPKRAAAGARLSIALRHAK